MATERPSQPGLRGPVPGRLYRLGGRSSWRRLWAQVTLLLLLTFGLLALISVWAYERYWNAALQTAPPEVRRYVEQVRPVPGRPDLKPLLRPGLRSVLLSVLVMALMSALIARWLFRPLRALERAVEQVAGGALGHSALGNSALGGAPTRGREPVFDLGRNLDLIAARLEQAEALRRLSSASVAHELRTPLTALRSRIEALEYGVFALTPAEVAKLHPSLDVLERLCSDLQLLTLADAEGFALHLQPLELCALGAEALADVQARADRAGIDLVLEAGGPLELLADPQRLRQMLGNLLDNALTHTPAGGSVRLRLSRAGPGQALIEVADSGPGVAPGDLEHVFTAFWRADPSRSRRSGGSGLGLAVVRALTEAHRGQVRAIPSPLGGLAIQIVLPHSGPAGPPQLLHHRSLS